MKSAKSIPICDAEVMLSGPPCTALSPLQTSELAILETGWNDARRLAELAKNYSRASTAAKALCGIKLRALREHYFGPRNPNGGRPKKPTNGEASWESMVADKIGIPPNTAKTWMKMADVVESLAEGENLGLRDTLEKLPWDWTPEESAAVDAAVHRLTEDKTQRELLQSDFLADLGYTAPERPNSSNNPFGKNGVKKPQSFNPAEMLKKRQEVARLRLCGTAAPGRFEPASLIGLMNSILDDKGKTIEAMPDKELEYLHNHFIKPFTDLIRKRINRN